MSNPNADTVKLPPPVEGGGGVVASGGAAPGDVVAEPVREPVVTLAGSGVSQIVGFPTGATAGGAIEAPRPKVLCPVCDLPMTAANPHRECAKSFRDTAAALQARFPQRDKALDTGAAEPFGAVGLDAAPTPADVESVRQRQSAQARNVGSGTIDASGLPATPGDCAAIHAELNAAIDELYAHRNKGKAARERVLKARDAYAACEAERVRKMRKADEAVADEPRPKARRGKAAVAVSWSWNVTTVGSTLLAAYYALMILTGSWRLPWVSIETPVPRSARVLDALYRRGHVPPEAEAAARKALVEDGAGDPEGGGR